MTKYGIATFAGGVLAVVLLGLATPAAAAPRGPDDTYADPNLSGRDSHSWWTAPGSTPYGTYQNDSPRQSGARR